jgi:D-alanine-D-alanine ligase
MIAKNLDKKKYQVFLFDPAKDLMRLANSLKKKKIDVVFPALHGTYGEDGTIQGMLELFKIPYVFSGVLASALAMDKDMAKKIFKKEKIPVPKHFIFTKNNHISLKKVKFPCVVKPILQGSSVGVTIVTAPSLLKKALKKALEFGPKAMIEDFIEGREVTAAVLGNSNPKTLPLIEIKPKISHFFDYKAKYEIGGSEEICPAKINSVLTKKIQELAIKAHKALGCRGVSRTDLILHGSQPFVLEINTIPGMTKTSLVPQAAAEAGIDFPELLDRLIELAQGK